MKRIFAAVATVVALALPLASCDRPSLAGRTAPKVALTTYTVQGFLRGINFAESTVTVEHEDIPNFMPAMTMPFSVKSIGDVEPFKVGDPLEFRMFVTADSSWIEGIRKIEPREVSLPVKADFRESAAGDVTRLKEGDRLPEFRLVDSQARGITRETFAGRPLLLTFIFVRCPLPNFCPLMMSNFRDLSKELEAASEGGPDLQFLSISFDSENDTPEVLREYAAHYTEDTDRWRFASGISAETNRLTQAFAVTVQTEAGTISHGLATAFVDSDGVIRRIWRGNGWKPSDVLQAVRKH